MVFKLVRVDAEEPNKIELPLGTHSIGRGKFLNCEDKRISRNHGNLIITEHFVAIEALHQNPCFTLKKGEKETQVVRQLSREKLVNGDRFGLLPGSFWYEVLQCTPETDSQATDVSLSQEQNESAQIMQELNETKQNNQDQNETTQNNQDQNETTQNNQDQNEKTHNNVSKVDSNSDVGFQGDDNSQVLDFDLNETVDNERRSESPSLLDNQEQAATTEPSKEAGPDTSTTANQIDEAENNKDTTANLNDESGSNLDTRTMANVTDDNVELNEPKSPSPKRGHSPDSDVGAKKIKTELEDVKPDLLVKAEPVDAAGPSNQQAGAPDTGNDPSKAAPPSPPKPPNRERCLYGADCYRRNPQHKAQFSHPRDADWGPGERAACPYGAACRKRDPRHWRLHLHPPQARPPPPVPRTEDNKCWRKKASEGSEQSDQSDSQELPTNNLIVTGKRARKPLPQQSPGSESEEEDPFQSDGSEDWEPPTTDTAETVYSDQLLDF